MRLPTPTTTPRRLPRWLAGLAALLTLLLIGLLTPALAQETCGIDPATSPNHSDNYILGDIAGEASAMHWETGLVWKRCVQGRSGADCSAGSDETQRWNEWMDEFMPRSFTGQDDWWGPADGYIPNPATGPVGVDRLQDGTWRMAYRNELASLITDCDDDPKINRNVFPSTPSSDFWSGSPQVIHSSGAWDVSFYDGIARSNVNRSYAKAVRLVRAGQPFANLNDSAPRTEAAGSQATFGHIMLTPSSGSGTAWGGARISGEGNPEFSLDGGSSWVTEAVVQSGDAVTVRMTAGAIGTTRTATLSLRSGLTNGSRSNCWECGLEGTTLMETTADFTVTVANIHTLVYTAGSGGTLSGDASQTITEGDDGSPVTAVPDVNYHFTGWDDGMTTATRTDTNVQADLDITALFAIDTWTVTFADWDASVLDTQTVNHGSDATAPADPVRSGHTFTGWDMSFANVTSDLSVTAQYSINNYTVSASVAGDHGSIAPASQTVDHGDVASFIVTADAGYVAHTVSGCGGSLAGNTYTTAPVTAECSLSATFALAVVPVPANRPLALLLLLLGMLGAGGWFARRRGG